MSEIDHNCWQNLNQVCKKKSLIKAIQKKMLPFIPWKLNLKRKALVNSLTILQSPMSVGSLVEYPNNVSSSKKEKLIWKIYKELKTWGKKTKTNKQKPTKNPPLNSLQGKKSFLRLLITK